MWGRSGAKGYRERKLDLCKQFKTKIMNTERWVENLLYCASSIVCLCDYAGHTWIQTNWERAREVHVSWLKGGGQDQSYNRTLTIKLYCLLGFPGGAVVESLPANAGDTGSSPGLGRSHMPRSNWAHEPQLLSLRIWSLCSATGGAAMVGGPRTAMNSGPRLPQLEKALTQRWRPNTAIK